MKKPKVSDQDLSQAVGVLLNEGDVRDHGVCAQCLTEEERLEITKEDLLDRKTQKHLSLWRCRRCGERLE